MQATLLHISPRAEKACSRILLPLALLLAPWLATAQDLTPLQAERDVQLWSSLKIEREIFDDLTIKVEPGYRMDQNLTQTRNWLADIGLEYKLNKHVRFKAAYRQSISDREGRSRVNADLVLSQKVKRYKISLRNRIQRGIRPDGDHSDYLRERLTVAYNIKKNPWSPFVATELYYHFWYRGNQWEVFRFDAGVQRDLSKRIGAEWYYRFEREFNVVRPELNHIFGIELKYKWK